MEKAVQELDLGPAEHPMVIADYGSSQGKSSMIMPSLASALDDVRSGDSVALRNFGDQLEIGLKRRLASKPAAMHSFVQVMLLAKALHH